MQHSPLAARGGSKRLKKTKGVSQPTVLTESQDEISRVLETPLPEENEVDDEVDSTNPDGLGVTAPGDEEACMKVVPYVFIPEVASAEGTSDESKIYMDKGEDILQKTRMFSCYDCPPIPLCRLIPYARVRGLRDDLSGLKVAFAREGYVPEKGAFIVSIWTRDKQISIVDEAVQRDWDPIWHEVNKEFEDELLQKPALQELVGRMFYVWEGNHRTVAWTSSIKECFKETKAKHCRVLCTIVDPTRVSEIALLTSLQRMNYLNTHALVTTTLRDELVNCANICNADHEDYIKDLPERDRMVITRIRKKNTKGVEPWYPLTRRYLGKLLFNVQISKALNKKLEEARLRMSYEELQLFEEKENEDLATRYGDRIGKILNVIDPKHGDTWRSKIWSLKWGQESFATLEKLNLLALCDAAMESKIFWLSLLEANKATKSMYGLVRGDHIYRLWLKRETMLEKIYYKAKEVLVDYVDVPGGVVVPSELSLFDYYEEVKIEMRTHLFPLEIHGEPKVKKSNDKCLQKEDLLLKASMRLLFRYFVCLRGKELLPSIPVRAKQWLLTINEETCMYPRAMWQYTQWELDNCPWWIDLDSGFVLKREKELFSQIKSMVPKELEKRQVLKEKYVEKRKVHVEKEQIDIANQNRIEIEDLQTEDCNQGNALQGEKRLSKRITQFVYLSEHTLGIKSYVENPKSIVVVGDYITIGMDFVEGKKNDTFLSIHEFMKQNKPLGVQYIRQRKSVDWAADFIFLDLPFGGTHGGDGPPPIWDIVSEDHIRYGIALASSTLADSGWLLVMASMTGDSTIGWIERFVRIYDLEIVRRVVVIHHSAFGYKETSAIRTDCSTSMLFMVRRRATEPPVFIAESMPFFESLGMHPFDTIAYHYLPEDLRALDVDGRPWRGGLERCHTFLACYVHLYCRGGGVCLEMGCGTAPILKTCMKTGRVCASMDVDMVLMTMYVEPLHLAYTQQGSHDVISRLQVDDEVDPRAGFNPYD